MDLEYYSIMFEQFDIDLRLNFRWYLVVIGKVEIEFLK